MHVCLLFTPPPLEKLSCGNEAVSKLDVSTALIELSQALFILALKFAEVERALGKGTIPFFLFSHDHTS